MLYIDRVPFSALKVETECFSQTFAYLGVYMASKAQNNNTDILTLFLLNMRDKVSQPYKTTSCTLILFSVRHEIKTFNINY